MTYNSKNYTEQGGEKTVIGGTLDVADGGVQSVKSGGALNIEAGGAIKIAGTAITATATEINLIDGLTNTAAKLNTAGVWEREIFIEDAGAGVDISGRVLYVVPDGFQVSLASASIVPSGTAAGVDDANPSVWSLSNGADEIVAKTYDTSPAFPADGVEDALGGLHATRKVLAAAAQLKLSVTNGATANLPIVMLRLYGIIEKV